MTDGKQQTLPSGWIVTTLGQVARWGSGGTPSRKYLHFYDGSIPWIKTGELGSKYVRSSEECITKEAILKSSAKVFPKGSVGIAMYGATIGKLSIWGIDASTNQACAVAQPYTEVLINEFLYYFLLSEKHRLIEAGKGGAQPNISQRILKRWPIRIPPLAEQCRIVSKIDELFSELDKGVESLKKAREQLKVYRQAVLKHAFEGKLTAQWREENKDKLETPEQLLARIKREREKRYEQQLNDWKNAVKQWEAEGKAGKKPLRPALFIAPDPLVQSDLAELPNIPKLWQYVRLSEIAQIGSGMSISKSRKLEVPIETPYLSVANVQRGKLDLSTVKSIKIECSQLHRLVLKQWDVLFNEGGDRDKLGRGWVWESQIEPCITQNHVFRASPFLKSHQHSKWISYWGNIFGQLYFEVHGKQTTNLASINKTVLSKFPIPLPPIEEQKETIRRLESQTLMIDHLEENITSSIGRLNTLRQSILKQAYVGRLVSQDPNDEPASTLLDRIRMAKSAGNSRAQA